MVTVIIVARVAVRWFHEHIVVIYAAQAGIDVRTPLPTDADTARVGAEVSTPGHLSRPEVCRGRKRESRKQNLVTATHRTRGAPLRSVEEGCRTRHCGAEGDRPARDGVVGAVDGDRGVGEHNRRSRGRDALRAEVGIEPNAIVRVDRSPVETRADTSVHRQARWW